MVKQCLILFSFTGLVFSLKTDELLEKSITKHGYSAELHKVVTDDGYILTMTRIPNRGKPPLLLLHGLFGCSVDFTIQGPQKSLAFLAHGSGFDVWMGNSRGTTFSKTHQTLDVKSKEFWQFSFHELGIFDLPAMVDYVLAQTGNTQLQYIAHSQGSTQFLVLTSLRPEYNAKFASAHLSSPVSFIHHATTPLIFLSTRLDEVEAASQAMKMYELGGRGNGSYVDAIAFGVKTGFIPPGLILTNMWYFIGYHNSVNRTLIPELMEYCPAGGSIFQVMHFVQLYNARTFQQYDYRVKENLRRYGQSIPPIYPLHKITAPVSLYYSSYDNLNQPEDVELLAERLPNMVLKFKVPVRRWNHLDFMYDINANRLYRTILSGLKRD